MTLAEPQSPGAGPPRVLAVAVRSDPDYRNYWLGSTAFALGIWGFLVSMGVSARVLTDSPLRISLVSVAYFLPMFLLALPSGVLADTVDRRLNVMVSRGASAAGALVLAGLTASDRLGYGALLALCALTGATVVSEVAARQAYVTHIVRPDRAGFPDPGWRGRSCDAECGLRSASDRGRRACSAAPRRRDLRRGQ